MCRSCFRRISVRAHLALVIPGATAKIELAYLEDDSMETIVWGVVKDGCLKYLGALDAARFDQVLAVLDRLTGR
jgi:hypothetical protein